MQIILCFYDLYTYQSIEKEAVTTMKALNLQKLLHALVVTEECSLVAASKRLHITQSALTRSVKSLEDDLGIAIFRRKSTGVELTNEGERLMKRARALLEQAGEFRSEARSLSSGSRSVVSFGLDPILSHNLLSTQLKTLISESRLMQIQVKVDSRSTLLAMLLEKSIDFFIADISDFKPSDTSNINIENLQHLRGSFFVRRRHPLSQQQHVSRADIYSYPILTPANVHESIWEELRWHGVDADKTERRQQLICPDMTILKDVTINSDAVLASSDLSVAEECRKGKLVRVDHRITDRSDFRSIGLVTLKDGKLGIHAKEIMSSLAATLRDISAQ